jgi:hypothetical protein
MDKVIVYVDDAAYAQSQLVHLLGSGGSAGPTQWVLVACAPRVTHRISKWVTHSARENWRNGWADKLFSQLLPALRRRGDVVTPLLARGPLPELTEQLKAQHDTHRVIDARRPKSGNSGNDMPPSRKSGGWGLSSAMAEMGMMLTLAGE